MCLEKKIKIMSSPKSIFEQMTLKRRFSWQSLSWYEEQYSSSLYFVLFCSFLTCYILFCSTVIENSKGSIGWIATIILLIPTILSVIYYVRECVSPDQTARMYRLNWIYASDKTHKDRAKRKSAFEHAQNVWIHIILHMRKVSSGHLFCWNIL